MRRLPAVLVLVSFALASGCAAPSGPAGRPGPAVQHPPPPTSALTKARVGMLPDEVEAVAGKPTTTDRLGSEEQLEVWYYEDGVVIFQGGRVRFLHAGAVPST